MTTQPDPEVFNPVVDHSETQYLEDLIGLGSKGINNRSTWPKSLTPSNSILCPEGYPQKQ